MTKYNGSQMGSIQTAKSKPNQRIHPTTQYAHENQLDKTGYMPDTQDIYVITGGQGEKSD